MKNFLPLLFVVMALPVPAVADEILVLNCTLIAEGKAPLDKAFTVDFTQSTVGGMPATISANEIRWIFVSNSGGPVQTTISRLSGSLVASTDEFPMLLTGHCAPAHQSF